MKGNTPDFLLYCTHSDMWHQVNGNSVLVKQLAGIFSTNLKEIPSGIGYPKITLVGLTFVTIVILIVIQLI